MSGPLFQASELATILDLPVDTCVDVAGISIDSRTLQPGDLFIALKGADARYHGAGGGGRDGHEFVAAAAVAGAAAALVAVPTGAALAELVVDDPFDALWALAQAARERLPADAIVFAITGSSGKTTARGMLSAGLETALDRVHASQASLNNHIGVPLSLARTPRDSTAAVFEIGTNSSGEIAPLSRLVRPRISILLNVLPVHLEGLGDLAGVRREKLGIAAGLDASGVLILHEEVAPPELADHAVMRFGRGESCDLRLLDQGAAGDQRLRLPGGREIPTPALAQGPHRRLTACAVLAAIHAAGLDAQRAAAAVSGVAPAAGRGSIQQHGEVRIIDDAYNANPESMRQALLGLAELDGEPRLALLGDMLELGADSRALHLGLADACDAVDLVFLVGEEMQALHQALPAARRGGWWPDCDALDLDRVLAAAAPGAVLLVKGSNRGFWQHGTVAALERALAAR